MVYVFAKKSNLCKYIGEDLEVSQIEETLKDLGMDVKGFEFFDDGDCELKVEITAEKLDMVSEIGIARTIKYYKQISKDIPRYSIEKSGLKLQVSDNISLSRPKIVGAIIKDFPMNKENLDEIIKIQEKIHDSFGRGRKKAAIGIYPIDKISFPLSYSSEKPENINFRPLESEVEMMGLDILRNHVTGRKFAHLLKDLDYFPVLRDSKNQVLSMPPIINSHDTGRVEEVHKDLFVECTGYNLQHLDNILKVIITTFIEIGAKAESIDVEYLGENSEVKEIYSLSLDNFFDEISLNYINSLLGVNISSDEISDLLNKVMLGCVQVNGDIVKVEVPCFRCDVWNDCDIADDVARAYGYNNIIISEPQVASVGKKLDFSDFREIFSSNLIGMGFTEFYTYMLSSSLNQFKDMEKDEKNESFVKIVDSADQGINMIRTLILPENLKSLNVNRKNKYPQKVFENGFVISEGEETDTNSKDFVHLSVSIADYKSNYTEIKSVLDTLLKLNEIDFSIEEKDFSFLIEGRSASILFRGEEVGFVGELKPKILENFGLIVPVSSFEINLSRIYELINLRD